MHPMSDPYRTPTTPSTSTPDETVDLRREALRIALGDWPSSAHTEAATVVARADTIAAYLRDGTVPQDGDSLADALFLAASHLEDDKAYSASDLRAIANGLDQ